jgi:hypothetical protein
LLAVEIILARPALGYWGKRSPTGYYQGEVTLQPGMANAIAQCEQRVIDLNKS